MYVIICVSWCTIYSAFTSRVSQCSPIFSSRNHTYYCTYILGKVLFQVSFSVAKIVIHMQGLY